MKIDRLVSIIMLLLEHKKISIPKLAKICEVSVRTIHRDLETINQAGIPIVTYTGVNGGVSIMESYKLEKRLLTTNDITTLLMGLGSIRSLRSGKEIANVLAKIKGIVPEEQFREIELKAGQITIDMTPWVRSSTCQMFIEKIQTALDDRRLLCFSYIDRFKNTSERIIEPYRLILKNMAWYVEGYCLKREDYRVFKLSRISEMAVLEEHYEPRDFCREALWKPTFEDKDSVTATLRINEEIQEKLLDLYGEECIEPESTGRWIANIPISNDESGYKFILSLGMGCECLGPEQMCVRLIAYIKQIYALYEM